MFHPDDPSQFTTILTDLYSLASLSDYIRDMRINELLSSLLTLLMEQSWHPESKTVSRKRLELVEVKNYLDEHYTEKIVLDKLTEKYYINKYYLTKIFKETYGSTISNYLVAMRITKAKQLLRFTGFAHGYLTLEDDTLMQWCVDNDFCAEAAKAVRYDSDFIWESEGWPAGEYIVSGKDKNAEKFSFSIAKTR